ncbi:hypothetical protein BLA29_003908 [Euroglyphus maynei]|uniref:Angiotensin-converting enzyme n=1 Tax=Euroglyphus maynei TaxID=6958 RepID=A0A1Y3AX66_EURMA|nr:hypothetical protein BLA29_003908 [Euroglyphus maynei]
MYNNVKKDDVRMNDGNFNYNFRRICHELGHVYYFIESNHHDDNRSNLYRMTYNSAAHESIGEIMRMAWNGCQLRSRTMLSPSIFERLRINTLMGEALSTLVIIPFGMILEEWRNQTFTNNRINLVNSNRFYWMLRERIQHIRRPLSSDDDHQRILDPLLKYHVANFQPYWRYVFGVMLQHQFHQKICGHHHHHQWSSLVECCPGPTDFNPLRKLLGIDLMQTEFSVDDLVIIRKMFDSNKIEYRIEPLLDYYQPLINWLYEWKRNKQLN